MVDLLDALKASLAAKRSLELQATEHTAEIEGREKHPAPWDVAHSHFERWRRDRAPQELEQAEQNFLRVERGEEPDDSCREESRADACRYLGEIAVAKERPMDAARWFRKAIEANTLSDEPADQLARLRPVVLAAAEAGDPQAQFEVAEWFLGGLGVARDRHEAAALFERAAAQGLAPAMYRLGELHERGEGMEQDRATALKFYRRAAEAGHADAQYRLWCMEEEDPRAACRWLGEAAAQDHLDAMVALVDLQYIGVLVGGARGASPGQTECFVDGALPLLLRSAVRGHAKGQYLLSMWYASGSKVATRPTGRQTPGRVRRESDSWHVVTPTGEDEREALYWLRRSAAQGYAPAETELGQRCRGGQGVAPDESLAVEWLRRGAIHGEDEARLALACLIGRRDDRASLNEAAYWFLRVATSSDAELEQADQGRYWFGYVCEFGRGVEQSDMLAFKWYLSAAEGCRLAAGHPEARNRLGALCQARRGLPRDDWGSTVELLSRAARVGALGAAEVLAHLSAHDARVAAYRELLDLIGMEEVKATVRDFLAKAGIDQVRGARGLRGPTSPLHCVFSGPPGTGKTTVARILGKLLSAVGVLSRGHVKEVDRAGLVGRYVGETALKVDEVVQEALGGVLFIDEAYSLTRAEKASDYGYEAVDTLVKRMEDHRADLVVIVAGYEDEMKAFLRANTGLESRFPWHFRFRHYTPAELLELFHLLASQHGIRIAGPCSTEALALFTKHAGRDRTFGNGRFVRTVYEKAAVRQATRLTRQGKLTDEQLQTLLPEDLPLDV